MPASTPSPLDKPEVLQLVEHLRTPRLAHPCLGCERRGRSLFFLLFTEPDERSDDCEAPRSLRQAFALWWRGLACAALPKHEIGGPKVEVAMHVSPRPTGLRENGP